MLLKTIIVEDEILARKSMERLVNKNQHLHLLGVCNDGADGVTFLKGNAVDLILLDVEMPSLDGFGMLEELEVLPHIIVTSTKENYAFTAFQYQVDGYLKKPVTIPQFNAAIEKLVQTIGAENIAERSQLADLEDIYFKVDNRLVRFTFDEILYIENLGDYVKVVAKTQEVVVHTTMKWLEQRLPVNTFSRVHRTYIVNLKNIKDIEQNSIVIAGKIIPVSRASKPELISKLNLL